ncbi:RNA polymerase subunit sigma [Amycolatopsis sp. WAC 01375]|uniref:ECF RNA polymerase sigma factor SigK n=1 Tax=unclassified Amycolatopsis TaxID=2618356 RepID=UPI000F7B8BF3|nr:MULTISPECIES: ECF RNA polymerase sigma factor SigK [unclassified Amycolatopsis]RSM71682.1 RNA polymerase subunit sigma [Amycolatopsis sp. WAC 01375]RSN29384.1 RNA polymerase subunit sigma [Amycolatopsis sp. WAC 01416]
MVEGVRTSPRGSGGTGTEPAETSLMQRVAAGDEQAFADLYDVVAGPVWGVVNRVVRNGTFAEEVTQEVLVEVWRTAARFKPGKGSTLAWVLTIAHRRAVDRVRSHQASLDRDDRAGRLDFRRPFDEVAESTISNLEQQRVRQCLTALTDLQRESVVLAYYNGYTYPEVAEVLKTAPGTVKTRIRDGLIRLRDCLGVGQ